jgi:hypothetical protein
MLLIKATGVFRKSFVVCERSSAAVLDQYGVHKTGESH